MKLFKNNYTRLNISTAIVLRVTVVCDAQYMCNYNVTKIFSTADDRRRRGMCENHDSKRCCSVLGVSFGLETSLLLLFFFFITLPIFGCGVDEREGGTTNGAGREVVKPVSLNLVRQPQSHYYSQWQVDHNIITAGHEWWIHTDNNYPKNPLGWLTRVRMNKKEKRIRRKKESAPALRRRA